MFLKYIMNLAVAVLVTIAFAGSTVSDSLAGKYKKRHKDHIGYVTAYSQHGHGSLTAPVRIKNYGSFVGKQVRLPGGVWIDCAISCAETLRVQKIDFWEQFGNSSEFKRK